MRRLFLLSVILITVLNFPNAAAEEPAPPTDESDQNIQLRDGQPRQGVSPRKGRMLVLEINTRIIEQNQTVVWNESHRKVTLPGRPVEIKLVGNNVVVAVQFTPYMRRGVGCYLVAQGQIWLDIPNHGIRYHTTMQTIPVEFGEAIYFFPLGPHKQESSAGIEVMLVMQPYEED